MPTSLRTTRRGFTLIELLVSLTILTVALGVVSVVFNTTTQTASRAAAMADTQHWLRQFIEEMKRDLEGIDPSESVLIMVGRTQPAALTDDDRFARIYHRVELYRDPDDATATDAATRLKQKRLDAELNTNAPEGWSDPRADILAFFTERQLASQAPPTASVASLDPFNAKLALGGTTSPNWIVYGHAALDSVRYSSSGPPSFADNPRHISDETNNISDLALTDWVLARRASLIYDDPAAGSALRPVSGADMDRLIRCHSDDDALGGDVLPLNLAGMLTWFSANNPDLRPRDRLPLVSPYGEDVDWNAYRPVAGMLYASGGLADRHVATVVQEPPLELSSNLALQMLPACAWFEVEFLMPEDPRNDPRYHHPDPTDSQAEDYAYGFDPPRWVNIEDGETYVFVPDSAQNRAFLAANNGFNNSRLATFGRIDQDLNNVGSQAEQNANQYDPSARRIRLWPYAIRITVRAFDPLGRLDEPMVRTIVHRFD